MSGRKVIVSCAITGSIHVPSLSPHLPDHAGGDRRRARSGRPRRARRSSTCMRAIRRRASRGPTRSSSRGSCRRSRPAPTPSINITTGGGHGMTRRGATLAARRFQPELCSLNMGSMNFGLFPMLDRDQGVQARLGARATSRRSRDFIFRNTFQDIERIVTRARRAHGTRFEFECYDVGHLYNLAHFSDRGLVEAAAVRPDDLRHPRRHRPRRPRTSLHMKADGGSAVRRRLRVVGARRRAPPDAARRRWARSGRQRPRRARGQHLPRQGTRSRSPTPSRSRRSCASSRELSLEIATPDEARRSLCLKGPENTRIT